jgi:hypothetical protein
MVRDTVAIETLALAATLRMSMSQTYHFSAGTREIGSALPPVVTPAAEKYTHDRITGLICVFLPARVFARCLPIKRMVGRGGGDRTRVRILGKLSVQVRYSSGAQKQEVRPPRRPVEHFLKVLHNPLHIFPRSSACCYTLLGEQFFPKKAFSARIRAPRNKDPQLTIKCLLNSRTLVSIVCGSACPERASHALPSRILSTVPPFLCFLTLYQRLKNFSTSGQVEGRRASSHRLRQRPISPETIVAFHSSCRTSP